MQITFSPYYSQGHDRTFCAQAIETIAHRHKASASIAWIRRQTRGQILCRFTLPGATFAQHDNAIRSLLELDREAEIRTSRAHYHGLADFEAQFKAAAES